MSVFLQIMIIVDLMEGGDLQQHLVSNMREEYVLS